MTALMWVGGWSRGDGAVESRGCQEGLRVERYVRDSVHSPSWMVCCLYVY